MRRLIKENHALVERVHALQQEIRKKNPQMAAAMDTDIVALLEYTDRLAASTPEQLRQAGVRKWTLDYIHQTLHGAPAEDILRTVPSRPTPISYTGGRTLSEDPSPAEENAVGYLEDG